jgi:hypothetical protein
MHLFDDVPEDLKHTETVTGKLRFVAFRRLVCNSKDYLFEFPYFNFSK